MAKQSPKQREIVSHVTHEFKQSDLDSSCGQEVKNPRQAVAIALHEAGASRHETPAGNRRNLARTETKERRAEAGRKGGEKSAPPRSPEHAEGGSRAAARKKAKK